ncbi:TPA: hypothetical protein RTG91_001269 [Campylobacter jejuni]|nr:hypothetical protein [Campylobacter jejuni]HDZ5046010.1 hypothetical protein [Campylobacter jejuni]HDZ5074357.1 hypothetical protein [Campylobacter jejuni]
MTDDIKDKFQGNYEGPYENKQTIVCEEKQSKFALLIYCEAFVYKVKLDNGYFSNNVGNRKCDFMLIENNKEIAIYVELKGKDLATAYKQILSSANHLEREENYKINKKYCCVVNSKINAIDKNSIKIRRLEKDIIKNKITILNSTNRQTTYSITNENGIYKLNKE